MVPPFTSLYDRVKLRHLLNLMVKADSARSEREMNQNAQVINTCVASHLFSYSPSRVEHSTIITTSVNDKSRIGDSKGSRMTIQVPYDRT